MPAALHEWTLPIDQLGEGAKYYKHDPAEAKRLLAAAGYPNGFPRVSASRRTARRSLVDDAQLVVKNLKDVGIDAEIDQKEYGAYIATCFYGKFDSMTFGPQTPFLEPDNFLFGQYYPGEPKNQSHINDPVVADLLVRQRRTFDAAKRREVIHEIQRYLAKQQYYVQLAFRRVHRRVGRRAQELRPEPRLRLRRSADGRVARSVGDGRRETESARMRRYLARRLLVAIPSLLIASLIVFTLPRLIPGDVVTLMLEEKAYAKDVEELRAKLGLDRPLHVQYLEWLGRAARGDLGESLWTRRPVAEELARRLPVTMELGLLAIVFALLIALPIGVLSATRQDTLRDYVARSAAMIGLSVPGFWLATLVIVLPAIWWGWRPVSTFVEFATGAARPHRSSSSCRP